jgi:hypothetical protein
MSVFIFILFWGVGVHDDCGCGGVMDVFFFYQLSLSFFFWLGEEERN